MTRLRATIYSVQATAVEEEKLKQERDAEREASEKKRQDERDKEKKDDGASGKRCVLSCGLRSMGSLVYTTFFIFYASCHVAPPVTRSPHVRPLMAQLHVATMSQPVVGSYFVCFSRSMVRDDVLTKDHPHKCRTGEEVEEGAAKKAKTEMSGFVKAEGETLNANGDESVSGGAVSTGLAEALKVLHEPCGDEEFVLVETKKEVDQTEVFHLEKVLHPQLHPAWLYFDKGYAEYVRADDVEVMLHNLGVFLSAKQVEQLVSWSSSVFAFSSPTCLLLPARRLQWCMQQGLRQMLSARLPRRSAVPRFERAWPASTGASIALPLLPLYLPSHGRPRRFISRVRVRGVRRVD